MATLTSGDEAKFPLQTSYGLNLAYGPNDNWRVGLDFTLYNLSNDTTATKSFSFDRSADDATRKWQARRLGLSLDRRIFSLGSRLHFAAGAGGGLMIWKVVDATSDSTIDVAGVHNETVSFAASEVFLSIAGDVKFDISRRWSADWRISCDYLTGAGAEFADDVISSRDRWLYNARISLSCSFGSIRKKIVWKSEEYWSDTDRPEKVAPLAGLDSDRDGVPDGSDSCINTPTGVIVDGKGCPIDSDQDGVSDGLDDCPGTDRRASSMVDIHGCPVDSDFDGVPDYLDRCPQNEVGAHVDSSGCPTDSDKDGIADGLDDCPNTLYGVDVDPNGCIDLSMLSRPLVLNIDYPPGSFEIDPNNRERIRKLARLLNFVPDIRMDINGYTDNIGTTVANKNLSEKRARRVGDYLVSLGLSADRIKVFGKGETNFVASNQTADGRAKNRRIEIVFYK